MRWSTTSWLTRSRTGRLRGVHLGHGSGPSGAEERSVVSHDVARREAGRGAFEPGVGQPLGQAGPDRRRAGPPAPQPAARARDPRKVGDHAGPGSGVGGRDQEPAAQDVAAQLAEVLGQVGAHELPRLRRRQQLESEAQSPVSHTLQLGGREPLARVAASAERVVRDRRRGEAHAKTVGPGAVAPLAVLVVEGEALVRLAPPSPRPAWG